MKLMAKQKHLMCYFMTKILLFIHSWQQYFDTHLLKDGIFCEYDVLGLV